MSSPLHPLQLKTSLDHLPAARREKLLAMTQGLQQLAPQGMIILFGSHARGDWVEDVETGYRSDFDFLIVVETEALAEELSRSAAAHAQARAIAGDIPVQLIVHDFRYLNREIRLGNYFFVDILREGVLLYDARHFQLARPKALTREEMLGLAEHNFRYWFGSASVFIGNCRYSALQGRLAEAAFLLHQATERYYHALLLVFTAYKPRTHDLQDLGERAEGLSPSLAGLLPRTGSPEDEQLFTLLKRAYIDARYCKSYRITAAELSELAHRVLGLAAQIRIASLERMATLCGPDAVSQSLPEVPHFEESILHAQPMPQEPVALELWKHDLIALSEHRGVEMGREEGRQEGLERGEQLGQAKAVLAVLAARGLTVDATLQKQILACRDSTLVSRWLQRAVTIESAAALLSED